MHVRARKIRIFLEFYPSDYVIIANIRLWGWLIMIFIILFEVSTSCNLYRAIWEIVVCLPPLTSRTCSLWCLGGRSICINNKVKSIASTIRAEQFRFACREKNNVIPFNSRRGRTRAEWPPNMRNNFFTCRNKRSRYARYTTINEIVPSTNIIFQPSRERSAVR